MATSRKSRTITQRDYVAATIATARLDEIISTYAKHEGAHDTVKNLLLAHECVRAISSETSALEAAQRRAQALIHVAHALYLVRTK